MTRATAALAPRSGRTGVLFHGMAGAGKTACALELAYTHERSFARMVWYQAPSEDEDVAPSCARFAFALEEQLPGVRIAHMVDDLDALAAFLPRLRSFLGRERILVVLDNCESLVSETGSWRDERWTMIVEALTGHEGLSRLVMTSRRRPRRLPPALVVEPVHALAITEAVLLARAWPHLRALLDATAEGISAESARDLAVRTLAMAQGHPKLIELADGQAADAVALKTRLVDSDRLWEAAGVDLREFFDRGEPVAGEADYLTVLDRWTRGAVSALPPASQLLFGFLCCLEPEDRVEEVVSGTWLRIWQRLGGGGDPPTADEALAPVTEHALVSVDHDAEPQAESYRLHPGVAATGRAQAGVGLKGAVDHEGARYWLDRLGYAEQHEDQQLGRLVLRAGRGALPYLLRQHAWVPLAHAAHAVLYRDRSTRTAAQLLPLLRQAAHAARGTGQELPLRLIVARALEPGAPGTATEELRLLLEAAEAREDYELASVIGGDLVQLLRRSGRPHDALAISERLEKYVSLVGMGPWTRIAMAGERLRVLDYLGRSDEVLDGVEALRRRMTGLPDEAEHSEGVSAFSVREGVLALGRGEAERLHRWTEALALNAERLESQHRRAAPALERAVTAFDDCGPLLQLGRRAEARELLITCREVFARERDEPRLAAATSALAGVEDELGHGEQAVALETDSLRLGYIAGDPHRIWVSHFKLGAYLGRYSGGHREALGHGLGAAVIAFQLSSSHLPTVLRALSGDLADMHPTPLPTWHEVCALVGGPGSGIRLAELVAKLPSRARDGPAALAEVLRLAHEMPGRIDDGIDRHTLWWEPVISGLVAVRRGDPHAARLVEVTLAAREREPGWSALSRALRRLADGDEDEALLGDLDVVDTSIARRALDALRGRAAVDADAWRDLEIRADVPS